MLNMISGRKQRHVRRLFRWGGGGVAKAGHKNFTDRFEQVTIITDKPRASCQLLATCQQATSESGVEDMACPHTTHFGAPLVVNIDRSINATRQQLCGITDCCFSLQLSNSLSLDYWKTLQVTTQAVPFLQTSFEGVGSKR